MGSTQLDGFSNATCRFCWIDGAFQRLRVDWKIDLGLGDIEVADVLCDHLDGDCVGDIGCEGVARQVDELGVQERQVCPDRASANSLPVELKYNQMVHIKVNIGLWSSIKLFQVSICPGQI